MSNDEWDDEPQTKSTDDFYTYGERPRDDDDAYWKRVNARAKMRGVTRFEGPSA